MRDVPSSEFRITYARLTEPVNVTALGRSIGTWYPAGTGAAEETVVKEPIPETDLLARALEARANPPAPTVLSVPKPVKRGKLPDLTKRA